MHKLLEKRLDSNNEEALLGEPKTLLESWLEMPEIRVQAAKLVTCSMRHDRKHLYINLVYMNMYIYIYINIYYIYIYVA